ncbi:hypothetical protein [Streptomyces sp. NPDC046887]|uniref:hypothetical protein n=1 Tax=Streptomyces sp. NPDC046887 TaxID=3155472 RepID=UPI0034105BE6
MGDNFWAEQGSWCPASSWDASAMLAAHWRGLPGADASVKASAPSCSCEAVSATVAVADIEVLLSGAFKAKLRAALSALT